MLGAGEPRRAPVRYTIIVVLRTDAYLSQDLLDAELLGIGYKTGRRPFVTEQLEGLREHLPETESGVLV